MENQYNPNFRILWAEIQAHPAVQPPFNLRLGMQSTPASGLAMLSDTTIFDCQTIQDAIHKLFLFMERVNIQLADDFMLVYPLYQGEGQIKADIDFIAGVVAEEAAKKQWGYERKLPQPTWW